MRRAGLGVRVAMAAIAPVAALAMLGPASCGTGVEVLSLLARDAAIEDRSSPPDDTAPAPLTGDCIPRKLTNGSGVALAVTERHFYWGSRWLEAYARPLGAGAPLFRLDGNGWRSVATKRIVPDEFSNEPRAFWFRGSEVAYGALADAGGLTLLRSAIGETRGVTFDAAHVYWLNTTTSNADSGELYRHPRRFQGTVAVESLSSAGDVAQGLGFFEGKLTWLSASRTFMQRSSPEQATQTPIFVGQTGSVTPAWCDSGDSLYWIRDDLTMAHAQAGRVRTLASLSGIAEPIGPTETHGGSMLADGLFVYWAHGQTLVRVRRDTGEVRVIAKNTTLDGAGLAVRFDDERHLIASDGTTVHVALDAASDGRILTFGNCP